MDLLGLGMGLGQGKREPQEVAPLGCAQDRIGARDRALCREEAAGPESAPCLCPETKPGAAWGPPGKPGAAHFCPEEPPCWPIPGF